MKSTKLSTANFPMKVKKDVGARIAHIFHPRDHARRNVV